MIIWTKIKYRIKWDSKGEGSEKMRNKIKEQIKILNDKKEVLWNRLLCYIIYIYIIKNDPFKNILIWEENFNINKISYIEVFSKSKIFLLPTA